MQVRIVRRCRWRRHQGDHAPATRPGATASVITWGAVLARPRRAGSAKGPAARRPRLEFHRGLSRLLTPFRCRSGPVRQSDRGRSLFTLDGHDLRDLPTNEKGKKHASRRSEGVREAAVAPRPRPTRVRRDGSCIDSPDGDAGFPGCPAGHLHLQRSWSRGHCSSTSTPPADAPTIVNLAHITPTSTSMAEPRHPRSRGAC